MHRRDISKALFASAAGSVLLAGRTEAQTCNLPCYPQTAAELALGVTPVNTAYPPGHVYRYGTNTTPGTTNMTNAINTCANVCRQGRYTLVLPPEVCLVSSTLNFTGIHVLGTSNNNGYHIQASSAQFDVITSAGDSLFEAFRVDGGWDGVSPGLSGDTFALRNTVTGFAYLIDFLNVTITKSKKRGIYWEKGGYGSIYAVHSTDHGLHGLELAGFDPANSTTTIAIGGMSQFSNCPNGYGVKLTECFMCTFNGVIIEYTKGIQIGGGDNRALSFNAVYQEFGSGPYFLDFGTSGGAGCTITNCIGGLKAVSNPIYWQDVHFAGNSLLDECPVPLANRILQADGGAQITATTGGVDVTGASLPLTPGTWLVSATFQTVANTAFNTLSRVACQLTTNAAAPGINNSIDGNFNVGAAEASYNPGGEMDQRLNCFTVFRTTSSQTLHLRARVVFGGPGAIGYRGFITAVKFQ